eukprot:gene5686-11473_t
MSAFGSSDEFCRNDSAFSSSDVSFGELPTPRPPSEYDNKNGRSTERQDEKNDFEYFDDWEVGPRYKLVRVLGHGSYGEVVEAYDHWANRKVAIKRIQNIFDQPMDAKRVYREMYILRHINHPHIIRLLDIVAPHLDAFISKGNTSINSTSTKPEVEVDRTSINGINTQQLDDKSSSHSTDSSNSSNSNKAKLTPKKRNRSRRNHGEDKTLDDIYLIFEFVDTDLYKLILSPQYLTTQHIQTFLQQMLLGLKYLHSANVIHRDLKPANILVNENCSLKICDFGLSRVVSNESMSCRASNIILPNTPHSPRDRLVGLERGSGNPHPTHGVNNSHRPALARCLTRHVVTRWYRAPELILLQEYSSAVDLWSLGCVLAELLSMQQNSIKDCEDRAPLFPGKSCPSLSGDGLRQSTVDGQVLETSTDRMDQLSVIFDVIGTPTESDIQDVTDASTREYLRSFVVKPPKNFEAIYAGAEKSALNLLKSMLTFNPSKRISVDDALKHEFLASLRWEGPVTIAPEAMSLAVESVSDNIDELKERILSEINIYHKTYPSAPPSATSGCGSGSGSAGIKPNPSTNHT